MFGWFKHLKVWPRPSPARMGRRRVFAWDKHVKIWQLVGAVLAIPAGIAGTYSFYTTYVVHDVSCDSLRSSIISVLDRNLDPEAKRALLRKDVADFDTHCGAKDPEVEVIFDAAIAPQQAAPAGMVQKQPAIAAAPTDFFGRSHNGERRGWISMFHRYADGHREANFAANGVPVTPKVVPPAVGTVLTALTMVSVWFEAPPQGQDNAVSQLQGRIVPGSCIKVLVRGAAGRPYWAEVEPLPCSQAN